MLFGAYVFRVIYNHIWNTVSMQCMLTGGLKGGTQAFLDKAGLANLAHDARHARHGPARVGLLRLHILHSTPEQLVPHELWLCVKCIRIAAKDAYLLSVSPQTKPI